MMQNYGNKIMMLDLQWSDAALQYGKKYEILGYCIFEGQLSLELA